MTDPPLKQGCKLHDPPPSIKTWVFGFLLIIQFKFSLPADVLWGSCVTHSFIIIIISPGEANSNFQKPKKKEQKRKRLDKGYPQTFIENLLSQIKFTKRESKFLKQNNKEEKVILPFVTQYQPSVSTIKEVEWKSEILYKTNHNFKKFLKTHLSFPYKKGKSLKHMLVRAKKRLTKGFTPVWMCGLSPLAFSHTTGLWVF